MQDRQDRPDYPTVGDPSFPSHPISGGGAGAYVAALEPYTPPNVPHGLPHVVRFATLSSMDLPLEVRFLIIMLARFADVNGVASVAAATLCEICRIGSHHTIDRWLGLAADVGILRKAPGQGGKDRKSNSYTFLGQERDWKSLPVGHPDINPIVALAQARRRIEDLETQLARIVELEAELVRLRNASATGHRDVTNGEAEPHQDEAFHSYETVDPQGSRGTRAAIGHSGVTDGEEAEPPEPLSHSYETAVSGPSTGVHEAIGHSRVTDGEEAEPPEPLSHSYETAVSGPSTEVREPIGHSGVTDGSEENHSDESSRSREAPASEPQDPAGHSVVTNGEDEGQQYLARRARVEALVMEHRGYYARSFRGGLLSAIEYFARSDDNEADLVRQVDVLRAGQEPAESGSDPPRERDAPSVPMTASGRREVEYCPDCGSPYTTFRGAEYCPDCTDRRRRERGT